MFSDNIVESLKEAAKLAKELSEPGALLNYAPFGKNGTVVLPFDTGMGQSVEDMHREDPNKLKEYSNFLAAIEDIKDKSIRKF